MDNKEALIAAATELIEEKGNEIGEITVREICSRARVGTGLLNYHFGSKENLLRICVERIINGVVDRFRRIRDGSGDLDPFEKLARLGEMTLDFLFEHEAISRMSILADMERPGKDDNTQRTIAAYAPLVAACRPDWDEETARRRTFCLISAMQQTFLRRAILTESLGLNLSRRDVRREFHEKVLRDILEVER